MLEVATVGGHPVTIRLLVVISRRAGWAREWQDFLAKSGRIYELLHLIHR